MRDYLRLRESVRAANRHFLYATNVGAGLPILQTLRDLRATDARRHVREEVPFYPGRRLELDELDRVTHRIAVPLSYAEELYALRNNIHAVRKRLLAQK